MEISKTLTGQECQDLTLFAVDTHASLSVPQENDEELMTLDTYGHGFKTPLATYDPAMQSWKTSEDISLWGEQQLLANLPKSGMTRNGVLFQQPDWVRPIAENASSSWPTPRNCTAMAATITPESVWNPKRFPNLETVVGRRMWPTPQSHDSKHLYSKPKPSGQQMLINHIYKNDPTTAGGKLNPMWVEWLMGFPIGWTDLED
jgi:hypothetical protein